MTASVQRDTWSHGDRRLSKDSGGSSPLSALSPPTPARERRWGPLPHPNMLTGLGGVVMPTTSHLRRTRARWPWSWATVGARGGGAEADPGTPRLRMLLKGEGLWAWPTTWQRFPPTDLGANPSPAHARGRAAGGAVVRFARLKTRGKRVGPPPPQLQLSWEHLQQLLVPDGLPARGGDSSSPSPCTRQRSVNDTMKVAEA